MEFICYDCQKFTSGDCGRHGPCTPGRLSTEYTSDDPGSNKDQGRAEQLLAWQQYITEKLRSLGVTEEQILKDFDEWKKTRKNAASS